MKATMLKLNDVRMSYDQALVLRGISLQVNRGEVFGLLGPSGCGKTTLLRVIAGLERIDSGDVILNGKSVDGDSFVDVRERSIGIVYQDPLLFPHLSNWNNVMLASKNQGQDLEWGEGLLKMLNVFEHKDKFPDEISGGQQQRVALARALVGKPDLLLLDEPFANLDVLLKEDLMGELKSLFQSLNMTVIFVSHDREEMFRLCDRLAVFEGGVLRQQGLPQDLYTNPNCYFVAEFLGKANMVSSSEANPLGVVRPEEIQIELCPEGDYRVVRVIFHGFYSSVFIEHIDEKEFLEVKVMGRHKFKPTDRIKKVTGPF